MFKLTDQQKDIIDHLHGHALVIAGPGSGKTVTLIEHVKTLVLEKEILPKDIWVMAFNRDIAAKLREKIGNELHEKAPEVTTIHSFIFQQIKEHQRDIVGSREIADYLGDCGQDILLWKPISKRLRTVHNIKQTTDGKRLDMRHVRNNLWNQLSDYWLISTRPQVAADELFDKFKNEFERFERIYDILFFNQLALLFATALEGTPQFRKEVAKPRIVIDEFQDLNPTEHAILREFKDAGTCLVVFGDDDQAVNDFRKAHAEYIVLFQKTFSPKQYPLARDKRCPSVILDLADGFVRGLPYRFDKPAGCAPHQGQIHVLSFENDKCERLGIAEIITKYLSLSPGTKDSPEVLVLCGSSGENPSKTRTTEIIETLSHADIPRVSGEVKEDPLDNEWGLAYKALLHLIAKSDSSMNFAAWLSVAYPKAAQLIMRYPLC